MCLRWVLGWGMVCLALLGGWPVAVRAEPAGPACGLEQLRIVGANPHDAADVCAGATRALSFYVGHGLALREPVTLSVAQQLPAGMPLTAAGIFLAQERRIHMLSFDEFRRFKTWFRIPIDRSIYQSLAAHEVAHAVTDANFLIPRPSIHAKEYLAYVALFATMTPALRERILQAIPGQGFEDEDRISFMAYMFDPMFFGAQAYRHYLKLGDRTAFLRAVLAGQALQE